MFLIASYIYKAYSLSLLILSCLFIFNYHLGPFPSTSDPNISPWIVQILTLQSNEHVARHRGSSTKHTWLIPSVWAFHLLTKCTSRLLNATFINYCSSRSLSFLSSIPWSPVINAPPVFYDYNTASLLRIWSSYYRRSSSSSSYSYPYLITVDTIPAGIIVSFCKF